MNSFFSRDFIERSANVLLRIKHALLGFCRYRADDSYCYVFRLLRFDFGTPRRIPDQLPFDRAHPHRRNDKCVITGIANKEADLVFTIDEHNGLR